MKKFLAAMICYGINQGGNEYKNLYAQGDMASETPKANNKYRKELNFPSLQWSETLAAHAKQWADHLSGMGGRMLKRSSNSSRPGKGENSGWKLTAITRTQKWSIFGEMRSVILNMAD
jgi:hypothetical protein